MNKDIQKFVSGDPQFLLDSMGDGVLIVDHKGHIVLANEAAAYLLGSKKKDLIGLFCLTPFGALDEEGKLITKKNAAIMDAIRSGKKTINATRQFLRSDGEKFWSSISVTPLLKKSRRIGAIIVFRDVTTQHLNHEYQADFARIASHQLRSPLGNLRWAVESLMHEKLGTLNPVQSEILQDISTALGQMNTMVNELMNVSRLQTHKLRRKKEKTAVEPIIDQVCKDLSHYASANNVTIRVLGKKKAFRNVTMGSLHLRTVIQNVVENAIRYSETGTEILIHIHSTEKKVIIDCTNRGIGIPADARPHIFSKFYRAKNAVKKQGDGTGLGMYITRELAVLYGGDISFDSVPGDTTTFHICLKK